MLDLKNVFFQIRETRKILKDYPDSIPQLPTHKKYIDTAIHTLLLAQTTGYARNLVAAYPGEGINAILDLQRQCAQLTVGEISKCKTKLLTMKQRYQETATSYLTRYSEKN